jgi:cold shock CspA family protein
MADKNDGAVIVANTSDSELAINLGSSGTGIPSWMRARIQGLLKSFNSTKLFGFIAGPDDRDVFLHASAVIDGNKPRVGDVLSFTMEPSTKRCGQMVAKNVIVGTSLALSQLLHSLLPAHVPMTAARIPIKAPSHDYSLNNEDKNDGAVIVANTSDSELAVDLGAPRTTDGRHLMPIGSMPSGIARRVGSWTVLRR